MIAAIVTRGFGAWGSIAAIVTRGFGIGEPFVEDTTRVTVFVARLSNAVQAFTARRE